MGNVLESRPEDHRNVVLLVEDNPDDVTFMREALKASAAQADLKVVDDGVQALAYLRRGLGFETAPRPNLILLDLNLPMKSGLEVLEEIKSDPALKRIPVVVLTSSDAARDVDLSYEHNANCYLTKPIGLVALQTTLRLIDEFWLKLVRLPST